jgi:hypothetical protein
MGEVWKIRFERIMGCCVGNYCWKKLGFGSPCKNLENFVKLLRVLQFWSKWGNKRAWLFDGFLDDAGFEWEHTYDGRRRISAFE